MNEEEMEALDTLKSFALEKDTLIVITPQGYIMSTMGHVPDKMHQAINDFSENYEVPK